MITREQNPEFLASNQTEHPILNPDPTQVHDSTVAEATVLTCGVTLHTLEPWIPFSAYVLGVLNLGDGMTGELSIENKTRTDASQGTTAVDAPIMWT